MQLPVLILSAVLSLSTSSSLFAANTAKESTASPQTNADFAKKYQAITDGATEAVRQGIDKLYDVARNNALNEV